MHTPGPWVVRATGRILVLASDQRETIVCEVTGASSNPTAVADARLIAAAPELLEAAEDVLREFGKGMASMPVGSPKREALRKLRDARDNAKAQV